jgi:hypothetical protein
MINKLFYSVLHVVYKSEKDIVGAEKSALQCYNIIQVQYYTVEKGIWIKAHKIFFAMTIFPPRRLENLEESWQHSEAN